MSDRKDNKQHDVVKEVSLGKVADKFIGDILRVKKKPVIKEVKKK